MGLSNALFAEMHVSAEWRKAKGHLEAMLDFYWSDSVPPWQENTHYEEFKKFYAKTKEFIQYVDEHLA